MPYQRAVVWFPGVRRAGKTTICRSLRGRRIVLDEIHRLRNPAEILKIAADRYPDVRVLATRSSTLGATRKFRDSLKGRKAELWLAPALSADLEAFGITDLALRLQRGGRRDDLDQLWEHYVLDGLHARLQTRRVNDWRDKQGHEIECKWSAEDFDPAALAVEFMGLAELMRRL